MAMPGILTPVPQLDRYGPNFEEYTEVLEAWFTANDIKDDGKRRSILLTSVGSKAYHTLRALVQPSKPNEKTYTECVSALKTHFSPKPTEIVQRYRFYTCSQQASETIAQFVAKLRQLSDGCNFKELDNMLRDRLVVGVRNASIQRKLLSESSLTFTKAYQTALAMEMAQRDVENIRQIGTPTTSEQSQNVNKVNYKMPSQGKPKSQQPSQQQCSFDKDAKCWRCGGKHMPHTCPFKAQECYKCHRKGHTKSQCEAVKAFNQK